MSIVPSGPPPSLTLTLTIIHSTSYPRPARLMYDRQKQISTWFSMSSRAWRHNTTYTQPFIHMRCNLYTDKSIGWFSKLFSSWNIASTHSDIYNESQHFLKRCPVWILYLVTIIMEVSFLAGEETTRTMKPVPVDYKKKCALQNIKTFGPKMYTDRKMYTIFPNSQLHDVHFYIQLLHIRGTRVA